jgi:hypothetical protein
MSLYYRLSKRIMGMNDEKVFGYVSTKSKIGVIK